MGGEAAVACLGTKYLGERSACMGGKAALLVCLGTKYLGERSACMGGGAAMLVCLGAKYLGEKSACICGGVAVIVRLGTKNLGETGPYAGTGPKIWLDEIGGVWSFMPFDADDCGVRCAGLKCGLARALWRGSVDGAESPTFDLGTGRGD